MAFTDAVTPLLIEPTLAHGEGIAKDAVTHAVDDNTPTMLELWIASVANYHVGTCWWLLQLLSQCASTVSALLTSRGLHLLHNLERCAAVTSRHSAVDVASLDANQVNEAPYCFQVCGLWRIGFRNEPGHFFIAFTIGQQVAILIANRCELISRPTVLLAHCSGSLTPHDVRRCSVEGVLLLRGLLQLRVNVVDAQLLAKLVICYLALANKLPDDSQLGPLALTEIDNRLLLTVKRKELQQGAVTDLAMRTFDPPAFRQHTEVGEVDRHEVQLFHLLLHVDVVIKQASCTLPRRLPAPISTDRYVDYLSSSTHGRLHELNGGRALRQCEVLVSRPLGSVDRLGIDLLHLMHHAGGVAPLPPPFLVYELLHVLLAHHVAHRHPILQSFYGFGRGVVTKASPSDTFKGI